MLKYSDLTHSILSEFLLSCSCQNQIDEMSIKEIRGIVCLKMFVVADMDIRASNYFFYGLQSIFICLYTNMQHEMIYTTISYCSN